MIACPQCRLVYDEPGPPYCGRCGARVRREAALVEVVTEPGPPPGPVLLGETGEGMHDPFLGKVVGGRYRILERIGAGGMGVVYRVEHVAIGKMAAMKLLHPALSAEREVVKRFRAEARAVSLLTHPSSVQVFDFGEFEGSLYMVMELVRGEDLGAVLDREGTLPWERTARILLQACDALTEAHEAGIIHRDLKPDNLLVSAGRGGRETVKVLDFGLAKLRERDDLASITARGTILGTPYYMSPEQIDGEPLDGRSDIYSLGVMMYRMLCGEYPFDGMTPLAVLSAHLKETAAPPSQRAPELGIEPRVDELVMRCLARRPEERFATVEDLRAAIEAAREPGAGDSWREPTATRGAGASASGRGGGDGRAVHDGGGGSNIGSGGVSASGSADGLASGRSGGRASGRTGGGIVAAQAKLSRAELDRFERSLKRQRWAGLLGAMAALCALGGGAWWVLVGRSAGPVSREVEPNNDAAHANLIAPGRPVRGHIGRRLSVENSDRDVYLLRVPRPAEAATGGEEAPSMVMRATLSALPNLDLCLGVYDRMGDQVAEADTGGIDEDDVIPNLRLDPGDYYLTVREVWVRGRMATENVTDEYTLSVTLSPLSDDVESEPDDTPQTALPLRPDRPMTGYLGRADDVDYYYLQDAAGATIEGSVSGVPGVDLRVIVVPPGSEAVADPAAAKGARVFDAGGVGAGERFGPIAWPAQGPAPMLVVARKAGTVGAGEKRRVPGAASPYRLLVHRSDAPGGGR